VVADGAQHGCSSVPAAVNPISVVGRYADVLGQGALSRPAVPYDHQTHGKIIGRQWGIMQFALVSNTCRPSTASCGKAVPETDRIV
jgi:hypothetical protein